MKIKILLLIAFLTVIYLHSCGEDQLINLITPKTELSGNIQNWNLGGNLKLKAQISVPVNGAVLLLLDTCSIGANGSFSIHLGTIPDSAYEQLFVPCDSQICVCNINLSPANARSSQALQLNIYNSFSDSSSIGYIYRGNTDSASGPGDFQTTYTRLAQNTNVTGNIICNYGSVTDTVFYNFSGTTGWNKVVFLINSTSISSNVYTVSGVEPSGALWFANIFTDGKGFRNPLSNESILGKKEIHR